MPHFFVQWFLENLNTCSFCLSCQHMKNSFCTTFHYQRTSLMWPTYFCRTPDLTISFCVVWLFIISSSTFFLWNSSVALTDNFWSHKSSVPDSPLLHFFTRGTCSTHVITISCIQGWDSRVGTFLSIKNSVMVCCWKCTEKCSLQTSTLQTTAKQSLLTATSCEVKWKK